MLVAFMIMKVIPFCQSIEIVMLKSWILHPWIFLNTGPFLEQIVVKTKRIFAFNKSSNVFLLMSKVLLFFATHEGFSTWCKILCKHLFYTSFIFTLLLLTALHKINLSLLMMKFLKVLSTMYVCTYRTGWQTPKKILNKIHVWLKLKVSFHAFKSPNDLSRLILQNILVAKMKNDQTKSASLPTFWGQRHWAENY